MLSRLTILWTCVAWLCAACSLDSSPKAEPRSASSKADGGAWQPRGTGGTGRRVNSEREDAADASKPDAAEEARDPAAMPTMPTTPTTPAPASSEKDGGAPAQAGGAAQPAAPANTSQDPPPSVPNTPTAPSVPAAGDSSQPMSDPVAGAGGIAGEASAGAGGNAGAAGSGEENRRQSLIDAAIEALGGGNWDGGEYPWRTGGQDGGGLNADFVKSVLFSLRASGTCFRDTRRCVQACFVIASDCKPCAEDPECAEALKNVCGPLGECSP